MSMKVNLTNEFCRRLTDRDFVFYFSCSAPYSDGKSYMIVEYEDDYYLFDGEHYTLLDRDISKSSIEEIKKYQATMEYSAFPKNVIITDCYVWYYESMVTGTMFKQWGMHHISPRNMRKIYNRLMRCVSSHTSETIDFIPPQNNNPFRRLNDAYGRLYDKCDGRNVTVIS